MVLGREVGLEMLATHKLVSDGVHKLNSVGIWLNDGTCNARSLEAGPGIAEVQADLAAAMKTMSRRIESDYCAYVQYNFWLWYGLSAAGDMWLLAALVCMVTGNVVTNSVHVIRLD